MPKIWYRDSISPRFEGVIPTVSIICHLFYLNLNFHYFSVISLLAAPRRLFCFGSLVILDVACYSPYI